MKHTLIIISLFLSTTIYAQSMKAKVELSPVGTFEVTTKTIRGAVHKKGDKLIAKNIRIPTRNLTSANETRDEHLKEKLEYKKFSNIVVEKAVATGGKGNALIRMRSVTKKVPFSYRESSDKVDVEFKLNLKEYGISGINYMGVGVQDIVSVSASLPLK